VRLLRLASGLILIGLVAPGIAAGQTLCPVTAGAGTGVAGVPAELRLAWIDARLAAGAHKAKRWTWGWGIGIGGATIVNLAVIPFVSKEDRIDWYVGAATTVVGIVPLLIAPLDVIADSRELREKIEAQPPPPAGGGERPDVCPLLADAETRLIRDAKNQADGQRWWLHVGNVALNFGVGLFLGLGYHHWGAGAWNAIGGSLIGEAIILTQPTASIDDLETYRRGTLAYTVPF
jgi:hypothetical protein